MIFDPSILQKCDVGSVKDMGSGHWCDSGGDAGGGSGGGSDGDSGGDVGGGGGRGDGDGDGGGGGSARTGGLRLLSLV